MFRPRAGPGRRRVMGLVSRGSIQPLGDRNAAPGRHRPFASEPKSRNRCLPQRGARIAETRTVTVPAVSQRVGKRRPAARPGLCGTRRKRVGGSGVRLLPSPLLGQSTTFETAPLAQLPASFPEPIASQRPTGVRARADVRQCALDCSVSKSSRSARWSSASYGPSSRCSA